MMELLFIFGMKMLDTSLGALKTIFTIKGFAFLAAAANAISYLLYTVVMKKVVNDSGFLSTLVVVAAVFFGQFLTQILAHRSDKDKIWKVSVTAKTWEQSFDFMAELEETGIAYRSEKCYNKHREKVLGFDVFCKTKAETQTIKELNAKYKFKAHAIELKSLGE